MPTKSKAFREITRQGSGQTFGGIPNDRIIPVSRSKLLVSQKSTMFWTPYDDAITQPGGRLFGAWIDAGGRSNSYNEDDVISGPVGMIESIFEDEVDTRWGITTALDTASFDTAYGVRDLISGAPPDWMCDIAVVNQVDTWTLVSEIAKQFGLFVWTDHSNTVKIKAFNSSSALDYYYISDLSQEQESLNYGRIIGKPKIENISISELFNSIQVNYKWDYGRNKFLDYVYVDGTDSNWDTVTDTTSVTNCSNAGTNYNLDYKRLFIDATAIQDQTTAELLCEYLADRVTKRRKICTFKTGLEGMQSEITDFINIQCPVINGMFSSSYTTKKWMVIGIRFSSSDLTFEITAIEV